MKTTRSGPIGARRRRLLRSIVAAVVIVLLCTPAPASGVDGDDTKVSATFSRAAGADRYETAAALAERFFFDGAPVVYVATGRNYADALAGSPAATVEGAPILLVDHDSVPLPTSSQLERLAPQRIVVLGGPAAVSEAVISELRNWADVVQRAAGPDRYATAIEISNGTFVEPVERVWVAVADTRFEPALAITGIATARREPILLVPSSEIPAIVIDEIQRLTPSEVVVSALGGGTRVQSELASALPSTPIRLHGDDLRTRYGYHDPVLAASDSAYAHFDGPRRTRSAILATVEEYPDALAAGAAAGSGGIPLLLASGECLPGTVGQFFLDSEVDEVIVAGGVAAVPDDAINGSACAPLLPVQQVVSVHIIAADMDGSDAVLSATERVVDEALAEFNAQTGDQIRIGTRRVQFRSSMTTAEIFDWDAGGYRDLYYELAEAGLYEAAFDRQRRWLNRSTLIGVIEGSFIPSRQCAGGGQNSALIFVTSPTSSCLNKRTMLHEFFHSLGAAPLSAPSSTGDPGTLHLDAAKAPNDLMARPGGGNLIDPDRNDYYGHNDEQCLDTQDSWYVDARPPG